MLGAILSHGDASRETRHGVHGTATVLATCSLCLVLTFSASGCSQTKEKGKEKFAGDKESALLEGKDQSIEVTFNKDVGSVSPETEAGVATRIDGKKVTFTQISIADDETRTVNFTVKAKEEQEETSVTIKVARDPSLVEEDLLPDAISTSVKVKKDGTGQHTFVFDRGIVGSVQMKPSEGITVSGSGRRLEIVATGAKAGNKFEVEVAAKGGKKGAKITIIAIPAQEIEDITFKDSRIDGKIPAVGAGALRLEAPIVTGMPKEVMFGEAETPKGLKATLQRRTVVVQVGAEAEPGSYDFWVHGKDSSGKVDSKAKLTVVLQYLPIAFHDLKNNKIVLAIPAGTEASHREVKVALGKAESVIFAGELPKGLSATLSEDKSALIMTVTSEAEAGSYDFWVAGKDSRGKGDSKVKLTAVLPGISFKDLRDDLIEAKIPQKGMDGLKLEVVVETGEAKAVFLDAKKAPRGLTATLSKDNRTVIVTVSAMALPGSYDILVKGKDKSGKEGTGRFTVVLK
jgi:hypothetical protein